MMLFLCTCASVTVCLLRLLTSVRLFSFDCAQSPEDDHEELYFKCPVGFRNKVKMGTVHHDLGYGGKHLCST